MRLSSVRRNWGFAVFALASAVSLAKLLHQPMPGHYRVFTAAARALWSGQVPYGTDFGTGIGFYFYSPFAALFVFGPFAALPEKLGLFLYVAISWALLAWGARRLFVASEAGASWMGGTRLRSSYRSFFWLATAFPVASAILASKLELLMTGITMLAAAWMIERRRLGLSAILFALILNWKFQPLPTVGLLLIAWVWVERDWVWPAWLAGALGAGYALPFAVRPAALLVESHRVWGETLSAFVRDSWLNFENVFSYARNSFGLEIPYAAAQATTLVAGLGFAAFLAAWLAHGSGTLVRAEVRREAVLLSLSLGATFSCAFSPLGQNNALVLDVPLLFVAFHEFDRSTGSRRTLWRLKLAVSVALLSLAYSDLIPRDWQAAFRQFTVKPAVCLALGMVVALSYLRTRSSMAKTDRLEAR